MFRLLVIAIGLFISLSAQTADYPSHFSCDFNSYASAKGIKKEKLHLDFIIDGKTQKSYVIGNNGSNEVENVPNSSGISFVEITFTGNIMVTSIKSTTGEAVHSRNLILPDSIVASQYYGACKLN